MEKSKVSIELIKKLRSMTGVGLNYCREALLESDQDLDQALSYLRKKGLEKAVSHAVKEAKEGLVAVKVSSDHRSGAIVEANAETDFVAGNEVFINFADKAASEALRLKGNVAEIQEALQDEKGQITLQVGEKIDVGNIAYCQEEDGYVNAYAHRRVLPGVGRVGVLLCCKGEDPTKPEIAELLKQVMMQIVATDPAAVAISDLDPALVAQQRTQIAETLQNVDKPLQIIERMIEGKMRKFYEQVVLLEQDFTMDPKKRVKDLIESVSKKLVLTKFVRFEVNK